MRILYLLFIPFLILSCGSTQNTSARKDEDKVVIKNEELEYEIIILEPGFNSWLATQPPESYYNQSTLEIKNNRWVIEWNSRVLQPSRYNSNLYQMQIDYDSHIDYGMNVNYMLFQYFTYFQQKYKQRL